MRRLPFSPSCRFISISLSLVLALGSFPGNLSFAFAGARQQDALVIPTRNATTVWPSTRESSAFAEETVNRYESSDSRIAYTGTWTTVTNASASGGSFRTTNSAGSCTVTFDGTAISVIATKGKPYGIMRTTVDGGTPTDVDLYARSTAYQQVVFTASGLANARHSVVITWTGTKNSKSTATTIDTDAFDITGTIPPPPPTGLATVPGDHEVMLSWDAVTDPDLTGYRVYRADAPEGSYVLAGSPTTNSYDDTATLNGHTYYYRASACFSGGVESLLSDAVSAVLPARLGSFSVSAPATASAGVAFGLSVLAYDDNGELFTSYSGTVALSTDGIDTPTPTSASGFVNGSLTVPVTYCSPEAVHVSATEGDITGTSGLVTVGDPPPIVHVSGTLNTSTRWPAGTVRVIDSNYTISSGVTLTIDPGTVVKFGDGEVDLQVYGSLNAIGTSSHRVTFTSLRDDAHGGDTNGDGSSTSAASADWGGILLMGSASSASDIGFAEILYGGGGGHAALGAYGGSAATLNNLVVSWSGYAGIGVQTLASPTIRDSVVENSVGYGFSCMFGGAVTLEGCEVRGNDVGMAVADSSAYVTGTSIHGNATYGIEADSGGATLVLSYVDLYDNGRPEFENAYDQNLRTDGRSIVVATPAYWGSTAGPSSFVLETVECEPWLRYRCITPPAAQVLGWGTQSGSGGEPVNTSTGNFYYSAEDLLVAGIGPEISVGRTYNHQDALADGVFGFGWTLDCDSCVQSQEDSSALVVYPGGSRKTFAPDGMGGYTAPSGALERLSARAGGGYCLTFIDGTVNEYSSSGLLETVTDRYGNVTGYARNTNGSITRISGAGDRYIDFTFTGDLVTQVADNAGRSVDYSYDATGNLTGVTDAAGQETTYSYDDSHRVISVASPKFPTSPFVSQSYTDDQVTLQHDGYGSEFTFSYDPGVTAMVNNRGFTITHEFDEQFRLTSETDGAGFTVLRSYDAAGLVASITDGSEHTTHFTYDVNGNQTSMTDPEEHASSALYDLVNNNLLWSEDAEGVRTTYSYDEGGTYLQSAANPVFTVFYGHYANGLVSTMTVGDARTAYEYDAKGNLTKVTDPLDFESAFAYDAASRLTTTTDALNRSTTFAYDAASRLTTSTDPLGNRTVFGYDANGHRASVTDQLGKTRHFTFDVMDKLTGVVDPLENSWAYTYDANYNLATVTNSRDATTTYTYAANDLLESVEDPLGHLWSFAHDGAGNTTSTIYPTGKAVTHTYTADDLLESTAFTTGESYAFGWTPTHRLESVSDDEGRAWSFGYNPVGWLTTATDTSDGTTFTATYTYHEGGRMTELAASTEGTRTLAYDLRGDLSSLLLPGASTATTYTYDAARQRMGMSLPNGAPTAFSYDDAGRLASITTTLPSGVIGLAYERDAAGRVTAENAERYSYDDAGGLSTWYDPSTDSTTTYSYDGACNLTGVTVDGQEVASFTVDAADRITNDGFSYDEAGNLLSDGEQDYAYDAACRLVSVKNASTEATVAAFAYDAANRRVSATDASGTVFFHYDGESSRVIAETDDTGSLLVTYAYDDRGQLHSMTRGEETYYYHLNARGDVIALSNASGDIVNTYRYDPWGKILEANETVANPYRYASYRYDATTGLYNCWNRCFAPELARFLTRDLHPGDLTNPVSMNSYLYCGGDPVNRADPSGQSWKLAATILTVATVAFGALGVAATVVTLGTAGPVAALAVGALSGAASAAWGYSAAEANAQAYAHGEMSPWEFYTSQSFNQFSIEASVLSAGGGAVPLFGVSALMSGGALLCDDGSSRCNWAEQRRILEQQGRFDVFWPGLYVGDPMNW